MKLAALAFVAAALTSSAASSHVLGWDYDARTLTYFDPSTIARSGAHTRYETSLCSWSYSPDRKHVAISDCQGQLRFLAVPSLAGEGRITWTSRLGRASSLSWLRPDRILAVSTIGTDLSRLALVDPRARQVVKRIDMDGIVLGRAVVRQRAVLLVTPSGAFGPPRVILATANGVATSIAIPRISAGTVTTTADTGEVSFETRNPGFAVDAAGGHAYVVAQEGLVADVDLATATVAYHGPVRALAKSFKGWTRVARWINGAIAVAGMDDGRPAGLQLIDASRWTARSVDPEATGVAVDGVAMLASKRGGWSAYDRSGAHLYDVQLADQTWLNLQGPYAYLCEQRDALEALDVSTGRRHTLPAGTPCPTYLLGTNSEN